MTLHRLRREASRPATTTMTGLQHVRLRRGLMWRTASRPTCATPFAAAASVYGSPVAPEDPLVELPDQITLTLDEVSAVLEVLDTAEVTARTGVERAAAREVIRLITAKLWPELGDLLDGDDGA